MFLYIYKNTLSEEFCSIKYMLNDYKNRQKITTFMNIQTEIWLKLIKFNFN